MCLRAALALIVTAGAVCGVLYLHSLSNRIDQVTVTATRIENAMSEPQFCILKPCPPDERIVGVVRGPGEDADTFALRALRLATDRTHRPDAEGRIEVREKSEVWTWINPAGESVTVEAVTTRLEGEDKAAWCDRHDKFVETMQETFPCE